jgi:hypothetical protein
LFKHPSHTTAALWLRGLVNCKILKVAEKGGPSTNRATRFYYVPPITEGERLDRAEIPKAIALAGAPPHLPRLGCDIQDEDVPF